jgi:hypothetical protein
MKSSSSESNHNRTKSKKHKKSSKSPAHSEESDEEIFDIKPLSGYVDDRKELHKEIFTLVSKKEVKDLLPASLKVWYSITTLIVRNHLCFIREHNIYSHCIIYLLIS